MISQRLSLSSRCWIWLWYVKQRHFILLYSMYLNCKFLFKSSLVLTNKQIYSSSHKSLIFCFAQLLLQILVNFQNQVGDENNRILNNFPQKLVCSTSKVPILTRIIFRNTIKRSMMFNQLLLTQNFQISIVFLSVKSIIMKIQD